MAGAVLQGRCLCGAVRVGAARPEGGVSACHCAICRRWSGAAMFGIEVPATEVEVTGEVARYRSSAFAERAFCPACGTHLWFRGDGAAEIELMPGLFDWASDLPLAREVYADRAFAAVRLAGDHRRITAAEYEAGRCEARVDG